MQNFHPDLVSGGKKCCDCDKCGSTKCYFARERLEMGLSDELGEQKKEHSPSELCIYC